MFTTGKTQLFDIISMSKLDMEDFQSEKKILLLTSSQNNKKTTKNKSLWWSIIKKTKTSIHTPPNLGLKHHPVFHLKNALGGIHQDGFVGLEQHIGTALYSNVGF